MQWIVSVYEPKMITKGLPCGRRAKTGKEGGGAGWRLINRQMAANGNRVKKRRREFRAKKEKRHPGDSAGVVVRPPKKIETEQTIKEWRRRYAETAAMEGYITGLLSEVGNSQLVRCQQRIIPVLAKLALLKDNVKELVKQHGTLYRWVWQYEKPTGRDGELCFVAHYLTTVVDGTSQQRDHALGTGWRWMLQINVRREKDKKDCWWDWVCIKKSNIVGGHLGVFAARNFPRGSIIGYYCGPIVWTCAQAGTEEPSHEYLTAQQVPESAYSICILNGKCVWQSVDPKPVREEPGEPMYLGMHYLNNVCLCFERGSPEYESARKYQNCVLVDEGSVKAIKKIYPGTELFTAYSSDESMCPTARATKMEEIKTTVLRDSAINV